MKRFALFAMGMGLLLAASQITITTTDTLSLSKGVYASITFTAKNSAVAGVPSAFSFKESGDTPPGMRFESYPCNKPDLSPCPALARADAIFLDGVPQSSGSSTFEITATDPNGNSAQQRFTVKVSNRK